MTSEHARRSDFKEQVKPDIEILLQFSLWLTKNGRDATWLMREAMAEAYRTWDEWMPEESRKIWLHKILTKQFFNRLQATSSPLASVTRVALDPISGDALDGRQHRNHRFYSSAKMSTAEPPTISTSSEDDVKYCKAIAGLPAVIRPAMILSYLEGFSNKEIANLAGVPPIAVESLLSRGRALLRDELFSHLTASDDSNDMFDEMVGAR